MHAGAFCQIDDSGINVGLADKYRLKFGRGYRLMSIDYIRSEGEMIAAASLRGDVGCARPSIMPRTGALSWAMLRS